MSRLAELKARGFDGTKNIPFTKHYRVRCSSCEALVINGYPTHESGCPKAMRECNGCNTLVPRGVRYCADCS